MPDSLDRCRLAPARQAPWAWVSVAALASTTRKPSLAVGGGDRAFAQVGLEQVGARQVGAAQAGAAQVGPAQAGVDQDRVLHVRAEEGGVVELGAGQVAADHGRRRRNRRRPDCGRAGSRPDRSIQAKTARAPPGLACHSRSCRAQMASSSGLVEALSGDGFGGVADMIPFWHTSA